jgi:hypothetical protein
VQVYRDGSVISSWGTGTTVSDSGLIANTPYTYTVEARDNNTGVRGTWHNSTGPQDTNVVWTLSVAPTLSSVVPSQTNTVVGSNVTWAAAGGFGAGQIQYYRYAWDQTPSHTFAGTEPQWSGGTIATVATSTGNWYLHVQGFNGADIANGTYDYAISATQPEPPQILSITATSGIVNIVWTAVSGSVYRVQYTPDFGNWSNLLPDVQATNSTASAVDDPGGAMQRFYRVMLLP